MASALVGVRAYGARCWGLRRMARLKAPPSASFATGKKPSVSMAEGNTMLYAGVLTAGVAAFLALSQGGQGGTAPKAPPKQATPTPAPAAATAPKDAPKEEEDWDAWVKEFEAEEAPKQAAPTESAKKSATEVPKSTPPPVEPVVLKKKEQAAGPRKYDAPYVLVGAGTASYSAMQAILETNPKAKVLLIGDEEDAPYMRPPLSKELWASERGVSDPLTFKDWSGEQRDPFFQPADKYIKPEDLETPPEGSVALLTGVKATALDVNQKIVTLSNGDRAHYEKLLLATGGRPRNLPAFERAPAEVRKHVTLFRKIAEFRQLDELTRQGDTKSVVVVGGGFLGSELAVALAHRGAKTGMKVTQVFPEGGNMGAVFPKYLSDWTTQKLREEGVDVKPSASVQRVKAGSDGKVALTLSDGSQIEADHVIVAVGLEPNVEVAEKANIEVDTVGGGILVNAELQARTDVYAAGDCASFHDPLLGRRRVEHHDHAVVSGKLAGENMANPHLRKAYRHQSMFWSDLGPKIGYEAVGLVDSNLKTVGVWAKAPAAEAKSETQAEAQKTGDEYHKGVVFYLRDNKVVGILLWNLFDKMAVARKVLRDEKTVSDIKQLARLFSVHE